MTAPPDLSHVPASLRPRLAALRPYVLVVLRKGPRYDDPQTPRVIQSEHLPYLFRLRDDGVVLISTPVLSHPTYAAIGLFRDQDGVDEFLANDPALRSGVFVADTMPVMGMPGDALV